MTKTEQIIVALKAGKSDEEILGLYDIKVPFLKRCKTNWKKQEIKALSEIKEKIEEVSDEIIPAPVIIDDSPVQTIAPIIDPAVLAAILAALQTPVAPTAPLPMRNCARHPHQTVDAGENCPHCLKASAIDNQRMINNKVLPPCPTCGNSKAFQYGGVIKKTRDKNKFSCGNCQKVYTIKGESCDWGKMHTDLK